MSGAHIVGECLVFHIVSANVGRSNYSITVGTIFGDFACKIGEIEVKKALRDVSIVLMPMLIVLLIVIFFPELILALPKMLMAKFI